MKVKSQSEVAQLCPTLSDPMDLVFHIFLCPSLSASPGELAQGSPKVQEI